MTSKLEISRDQLEAAAHRLSDLGQSHLSEPLFALLLAAPAVERQEPFRILVKCCRGPISKDIASADESMRDDIESARQYFGAENEIDADKARGLAYILPGEWFAIPLYTSPSAPVAAVLPARRPIDWMENRGDAFSEGWNACVKKYEDLNQ